MEDFINLCQVGMRVLEYSLKFTKLSKYAPSFMFSPRDEMSPSVMGVFDDLLEECSSVMLYENMEISYLIVHAQQVWESRHKRKNSEFNKTKYYDGGTYKGSWKFKTSLG